MDVNFEYKLRVEIKGLVELYSKFGTSYEEQYIRTSRDVIRLVCGEFVAQEYSFNRSLVGVRIKEALNHTLYDLQASVESVNILNIDLPAAFAQAIQESELVKQEKERVQFEKESADITANTMIIEAEKRAELRVSEALTNKTNRLLQKDAEANGITTRAAAEAAAYKLLKDDLGLTGDQLIAYIHIKMLQESSEDMRIDVPRPKGLGLP
eukprot:TRINITY_DN1010_c0_g1_i8.p1 TRINITY_DN1010_c0_g1~~TRINITY_DN1010_c0_g1_i8.p1  ORF type:complete len:210 (+),score=45.75 TRINITY_DN1010_c0_g1_i8:842-1471(+)